MSRWFSFSRFSFRGVVLYSSLSLSLLSPSLSLSLSLSLSRMALRLTDSGEEIHSALVRQEIHEPHEFPMQAAGGRRDQGHPRSRGSLAVARGWRRRSGALFESPRSPPPRSRGALVCRIPVAAVLVAGVHWVRGLLKEYQYITRTGQD